MKKLLKISGWIICGTLDFGMLNGVAICEHPTQNSWIPSAIFSLFGPLAFMADIGAEFLTSDHGFQFSYRVLSYEERWAIFHRKYPPLSRYYFDHGHEKEDEVCECDK